MTPKEGEGESVTLSTKALEAVARATGINVTRKEIFGTDDAVAKALQITDREQARIREHWRRAQQKIRQEEVTHANIVEREDGSVSIKVDPLTEFRDAQREVFTDAVVSELGVDRGAALIALKGGDELLGGRKNKLEVVVSMEETGDGSWRFRIQEMSGETRRVLVGKSVPEEIRHLTDAANIARRVREGGE